MKEERIPADLNQSKNLPNVWQRGYSTHVWVKRWFEGYCVHAVSRKAMHEKGYIFTQAPLPPFPTHIYNTIKEA